MPTKFFALTCVSFIGPPQIPITFDTLATAQAAALALIPQLNAAAIDPLNNQTDLRTISFAIPYLYPTAIPGTVVWLNDDCGQCGGIFGGADRWSMRWESPVRTTPTASSVP